MTYVYAVLSAETQRGVRITSLCSRTECTPPSTPVGDDNTATISAQQSYKSTRYESYNTAVTQQQNSFWGGRSYGRDAGWKNTTATASRICIRTDNHDRELVLDMECRYQASGARKHDGGVA